VTADNLPRLARRGAFVALLCSGALASAADLARSAWVAPGANGRLAYQATPAGDRIMDFSYAGYMGGGVALPDVPVKASVTLSGGEDDTDAIQAAIDQVSALPLQNGFRGAVQLAAGTYAAARTINISASGVVLRGAGSGAMSGTGTTIKLTGKPHLAFQVRASAGPRASNDSAASETGSVRTTIADAYVPSGAISFRVADAQGLAVGDTILIQKPVTAAWVKYMQMDDLTRDGKDQTWIRAGTTINTERRIAAIAGNALTLDVPVSDSFDAKYLNPPATAVVKIKRPGRVSQVGLEYLHVIGPPQEINHTDAHFVGLRLNGEDCWMRDVVFEETMDSIGVGGRRITLERVTVKRAAKHQGASKPAEFAPNASEVLLDRCAVVADNVWFVATGAGQAGPIVVLNATFLGNGRAEAHQRWTTGMLYDNCRAPDGGLEIRNRGAMGSGHGWSMGWGVIWNCEAKDYLVQNPPGAVNWLIGSIGHNQTAPRPFGSGPPLAAGTEDSPGRHVAPASLYLTQLAERLGPQALKNIGYASADPASAAVSNAAATIKTATAAPTPRGLRTNLASDRPVLTTNVRGGARDFAGWQALDADPHTYWATDDGVAGAQLELDTEGAIDLNAAELVEPEGMTGRVHGYRLEGFSESAWKVLAEGETIGGRKLARFPRTTVWKVRLTILKAEPYAAIAKLGLYLEDAR
jgi:hypothetical protein